MYKLFSYQVVLLGFNDCSIVKMFPDDHPLKKDFWFGLIFELQEASGNFHSSNTVLPERLTPRNYPSNDTFTITKLPEKVYMKKML